ncbi:MAG: PPOX class F420-dependent oxidoreductase [Gammaproteobacteria bacterium]|nr:PPOX class F420-dependent oxidoreductase [Gammaproteobacteria bacterium]
MHASGPLPAVPDLREALSAARYVSLATRRRDGREVLTPVWMAPVEARHFVFSSSETGKVKRIRNNPAVRLAVCDLRGVVKSAWLEAQARLVIDEPDTEALAYRALRHRYRWQMSLLDGLSWLSGRYHRRVIIEITF